MSASVRIAVTLVLAAAACSSRGGDAPAGARFVVVGPEVARDSRTGLEWTRHDDGAGLDWNKAESYCQALAIGDARSWRLPDVAELRRLYGAPTRIPCGNATCAVDPVFTLTSPYVWTATARGPSARTYIDMQFGTELSPGVSPHLVRRTLCVRGQSAPG